MMEGVNRRNLARKLTGILPLERGGGGGDDELANPCHTPAVIIPS
jgi:hypothetical protein